MDTKSGSAKFETKGMDKFLSLLSGNLAWRDTLDQMLVLIREELIFDNLVIYQSDGGSHSLDVLYAKSTGRGKSAEADASWGESIANRVIHEQTVICEEPQPNTNSNRLDSPYLLGIPMNPVVEVPAVLIFIRFGGPSFTGQDQYFAKWISSMLNCVIRRKMLEEFMAKVEEVQSISKLQSDFIHSISHELRSPLGFIKGYATTLLRTDTNWDRETQKDFLEIIERETNNLTDLIDDLLDSSRLQSGQMKFDYQLVRIDSLIRDEVNRVHLTHPELKIDLDFEPDIPTIEGDSHKLAQVIDNLLSNEIKYAPDATIKIQVRKNQKNLELKFIDDGPGIPDKYLPRMFTRFFRVPETSMKAHGSGLGLFICRQIVESHEGAILVASSDKGTIFTIQLPFKLTKKRIGAEGRT